MLIWFTEKNIITNLNLIVTLQIKDIIYSLKKRLFFGPVIYLLRNPLGPLITWAHILEPLLFYWLSKYKMKEDSI